MNQFDSLAIKESRDFVFRDVIGVGRPSGVRHLSFRHSIEHGFKRQYLRALSGTSRTPGYIPADERLTGGGKLEVTTRMLWIIVGIDDLANGFQGTRRTDPCVH